MATLVNRFINTALANTPGGNGTTNATSGVNRAYATSAEWEAAEQTDLPTADEIHFVRCAGAQDTGTRLIIAGWDTDGTRYIIYSAVDDKPADGAFDDTKFFLDIDTEGNPIMEVQEENFRVEDMQFRRASLASSGLERECIFFPAVLLAGDIRIERNIFKSIASDIAGKVSGVAIADSSPTYTICDNTFYDFNGTIDEAIGGGASSPSVLIYNNTVINCLTGIVSKSSMLIKNNIFQDCTTDISGAVNGSNDYNLTDNVSMPGANSVANATLALVDKAGGNFALVAGDTAAIGAGIGPSADANVPLSDIIGTARSGATTDIGAFVFVGGGGGSTLTADSGTYLYVGADASLLVSRIMQASSGSYSYTGTSINLLKGYVLTAQSGSYSYLGQDATLTYTPVGANILIADSGSYALTGTNINFNRDRVMIASSGSYLYQGADIQITLPGQIWTDKPSVATNWTNQTNVTTIWTDK